MRGFVFLVAHDDEKCVKRESHALHSAGAVKVKAFGKLIHVKEYSFLIFAVFIGRPFGSAVKSAALQHASNLLYMCLPHC
jgi:hypothetical protein